MRLTQRDEYGNADIIALSDIMPEIYAGLSFSEANCLTAALNKLADYEEAEEKKRELISPCEMCDNARISDNPELTDETDGSYFTVGTSAEGYRIMYGAGGIPPRLLFEAWNEQISRWDTIGFYLPKYCPNCGRKIVEWE